MLNAKEIEAKLPADMNPMLRELFMSYLMNLDGMQGLQAVHMTKALDAMRISMDASKSELTRMVQTEIMHFHFRLAMFHIQGAEGALSPDAQAFEQGLLELEQIAKDVEEDELFIQQLINSGKAGPALTLH